MFSGAFHPSNERAEMEAYADRRGRGGDPLGVEVHGKVEVEVHQRREMGQGWWEPMILNIIVIFTSPPTPGAFRRGCLVTHH